MVAGADPPRRGPRARGPLVRLAAAAAVVPVTASIGRAMLALLEHPDSATPAYVVWLCRRALCDAASPSIAGAVDPSVPGVVLGAAWVAAAICFGVALGVRRFGWITLPLAVVQGVVAIVVWNPIAFSVAQGAWWGQVLIIGVFVVVVALCRILSRSADSASRMRSHGE